MAIRNVTRIRIAFPGLPQIFVSGFMPQSAFAAVVVIVAAAAAVNGAKMTGRLDASQGGCDAWQLWQECLGLFGLVLLPQARLPRHSVLAVHGSCIKA